MVRGTALHRDDLIEDRELAAATDDRLAHEGIVNQLAALVKSVNTPSNIALYGPWGSGKTGIANLLRSKIDRVDGIRFVRFDAFKYADVPLRRNFISAVAEGLGQQNVRYHADLYSGRTKTDISVPPATVFRLLGAFTLLMGGLTLILSTILIGVAALQQGELWPSFGSLMAQAMKAGLLPASLLAALIALASKTLSVDRSLAKPESDEQFEQLFRDLVRDTRAKRLVVFIDELDRCSATEVVATLDTVRTFLGIDGCVFVIAADQNVLEEALTQAAKQETPTNDANPYYSTGSAYLDKVFQYQVSLPPLMAQSISNYAHTLVEGRAGVWGEINLEYVLSVLIPTHVTSPRRVKHLLNTFALTYRLAEERHGAGLLAESPGNSAAALAKLACLRVEFPLFSRHLEVDANLPNLVLQLVQEPKSNLPSSVSERVHQLAHGYALEGASPATLLNDDEDSVASTEFSDQEKEDSLVVNEASPTARAHNKQLLNYLRRTRQVQGPSRHLIYMQSTGTIFGLDGDLALAIERAAEDIDIDTIKQRIDELNDQQIGGVLELLSQQIRTGNGITGPNTARSFLLLRKAVPDLNVDRVIDSVIEAICLIHEDNDGSVLDADTIATAWDLAAGGNEAGASALRDRVITTAISSPSSTAPDFLLRDALTALELKPAEVKAYLGSLLVSEDGDEALRHLFATNDEDVVQILAILRTTLAVGIRAAVKTHAAWTDTGEPATSVATRTRGAAQASASTSSDDEPYNPEILLSALVEAAGNRETPIQHETLRLLLEVDTQAGRAAALRLISQTEPVRAPEVAGLMLEAVHRRTLSEWPTWLEGVSPNAIDPAHGKLLRRLLTKLWNDPSITVAEGTFTALRKLVDVLPKDTRPTLTDDVLEKLAPAVVDEDDASARRTLLSHTAGFINADFVDAPRVADAVVSTLQDTLAQTHVLADRDDALFQYVVVDGCAALDISANSVSEQQLKSILTEAAESPWLGEVEHVEVTLLLAKSSRKAIADLTAIPTAQEVASIVYNYAGDAVSAATMWVDLVKPSLDDFLPILNRLMAEDVLTDEFASAAREAQILWTADQRRALLDMYLAPADSQIPADLVLTTIGFTSADDEVAADLLCRRFSQTTNNSQRKAVIDLWAKAVIRDAASRKRLIETVVYGLLDLHIAGASNVSAVDLALSALSNLGRPLPHGVKGALGERVKSAVEKNESLENNALRVLSQLGYSISLKGKINKRKRLNYTTP
ncbi:P-loop NTPase fold protein [Arthrobacter sp. zg-Y238]|uniref:KAP family P-loop NTPase fold protein n=1 Tax=Arthrobacter sp. zg-Y238 TaxID=2964614 RepID=UPI0021061EFB|nr:KAP family NTPase [Arthrobacter sp. zg-Y238]